MEQAQRNKLIGKKALIGWREIVSLPALNIINLKAKIDTGARTSALHAVDIEVYNLKDEEWVSFHVPQPGKERSERINALVRDKRKIKNTSGKPEQRIIISTPIIIADQSFHVEVSLADRGKMRFDMILGRTAIRNRFLVAPGRSWLTGNH